MRHSRASRLILSLVLVMVLAGCGGDGSAGTTATQIARPGPVTTAEPTTIQPATTTTVAPTVRPGVATTTTAVPSLADLPQETERCTFESGGMVSDTWLTFDDPKDDSADWRFSTPEEQGLDSQVLAAGIEELESHHIYSFLVLRHDTIVEEEYFNGGGPLRSTNVFSTSKSMLSALVGIALREGYLDHLDQTAAEFLPDLFSTLDDPAKSEVTLGQLLTMTSGLQWSESRDPDTVFATTDWVRAWWSFPMARPPGHSFTYNTGMTHTMSAILTNQTGSSTCEFATRHLFEPLGITVEHWSREPLGVFLGGSHLFITPREMAKFGLLYMHLGQWQGEQIVPRDWVEESLTRQVGAYVSGDYDYGYGYWWQLPTRITADPAHSYAVMAAVGYGTQRIYLIPELDIVVVFTADGSHIGSNPDEYLDTDAFIWQYIIPALIPDQ
jgi:CubicO group peptidase (beta-lactamase class C family)